MTARPRSPTRWGPGRRSPCGQIDDLLTAAGFVDIALYAGPDGEPFRLGAPRLLLTARRRP